MNNAEFLVPLLSKAPKVGEFISKVVLSNNRGIVTVVPVIVSENAVSFNVTFVKKLSKKALYAPDLKVFYDNGIAVKKLAEQFGISLSYAYKLLKKD